MLRILTQRLQLGPSYALTGPNTKKEPGCPAVTWWGRIKKLARSLSHVGSSRIPGWDIENQEYRWFVPIMHMARNRNEWPACIRFCYSRRKRSKRNEHTTKPQKNLFVSCDFFIALTLWLRLLQHPFVVLYILVHSLRSGKYKLCKYITIIMVQR